MLVREWAVLQGPRFPWLTQSGLPASYAMRCQSTISHVSAANGDTFAPTSSVLARADEISLGLAQAAPIVRRQVPSAAVDGRLAYEGACATT
jgi:hypothetical protein